MLAVKRAILVKLELALGVLAILLSRIILALALAALHSDNFYRCFLGHLESPYIMDDKAPKQNRTVDLNLTMVALYRLSYKGRLLH